MDDWRACLGFNVDFDHLQLLLEHPVIDSGMGVFD